MKRLFTIATMSITICAATSCGEGTKGDAPWIVDRFDDINVIRYEVPGFETLPLEQKELVYYLAEAAKCGRDILFDQNCVANLPVRDGAAGCVLNVFTPANYAEFTRVLAPGGRLIKVVPGPDHLVELRELAGERLRHASHSNLRVVEHLERHMALERRLRARATFDVAPDQVDDLLRMTPLMFGVDTAELPRDRVRSVTVDAELLIAR